MSLSDHKLPASTCPCCGKALDGALGCGTPPKPGDMTICAYCACPLAFGPAPKLKLRPLGPVEAEALPPEQARELAAAQRIVIEALRRSAWS